MRGITFTAFATLLLVTSGMIGSGHIALAHNSRVIENSGNYQESQQLCGNSCTVSSSNVISQGAVSKTTPSPNNILVLALSVESVTKTDVSVAASIISGGSGGAGIVMAPSPITITFTGTDVPPNLTATVQKGLLAVFPVSFKPPTTPGTYTVQAHFAGLGTLLPLDSSIKMFTIP